MKGVIGIVCDVCKSDGWKVIDSRPVEGGAIRRRRICNVCGVRTTTYEYAERDIRRARAVIKALGDVKDG